MGNISGSDELVTKQDLKDFYQAILPYLGGGSGSSGGETTYTAGTGIDITNGVISATGGGGTTYTAGDGIVIQNDEISTDNMPAADMAEIITPLPSVMSRLPRYSTEEQIVGYWTDGKPLYQKTINVASSGLITWTNIYQLPSNCIIQFVLGATHWINADVKVLPMPYFDGSARSTYSFSDNILYMSSSNLSSGASYPFKGTLYYTKTTD